MAYEKTTWVNGQAPYMNADKMNKIEQGIYDNDTNIGNLNNLETTQKDNLVNAINEVASASSDGTPIGCGFDYFGDTAPENYMFADGSAISRTTYSALFAVIGTTYGSGDGETTFNLPDKRERVSVMYKEDSTMGTTGATFDTLGAMGGEDTHTLTINEMPSHTHPISNGYLDNRTNGGVRTTGNGNYVSGAGNATSASGGGQAHNILQPYLVCNYIIKVK